MTPRATSTAVQVFAVEHQFVKGDARYDIEDTATVTENGCELLSGQSHSRDLWVV